MFRIGVSGKRAPSPARIAGFTPAESPAKGEAVNLWPLYLKNDSYTSVLWPLADSDPYGFALRPFYNQEGNEYSILFPLSAWNPVNGDGWCLNAYWTDHSNGVIPFWHCSPGGGPSFCGPFYWDFEQDSFSACGLLPLFVYRPGKSLFFPPCNYFRKNEQNGKLAYCLFLPFGAWLRDEFFFFGPAWIGWNSVGVFPAAYWGKNNFSYVLLFWKSEEGLSHGGIFPFARWTPEFSYVFNLYWTPEAFGFAPLCHISRKKQFSHALFFWSVPDERSFGVFPFFWKTPDFRCLFNCWYAPGKNESGPGWGCFPLYDRFFDGTEHIGPAFWNPGRSAGFFPFWISSFESGKHFVFPLFYAGKDQLLTPFFGRGKGSLFIFGDMILSSGYNPMDGVRFNGELISSSWVSCFLSGYLQRAEFREAETNRTIAYSFGGAFPFFSRETFDSFSRLKVFFGLLAEHENLPDAKRFTFLTWLFSRTEKTASSTEFHLLGPLGVMTDHRWSPEGGDSFRMHSLLLFWHKQSSTPAVKRKEIKEIRTFGDLQNELMRVREEFHPQPGEKRLTGGFLPFYYFENTENSHFLLLPAFLSIFDGNRDFSSTKILPLGVFQKRRLNNEVWIRTSLPQKPLLEWDFSVLAPYESVETKSFFLPFFHERGRLSLWTDANASGRSSAENLDSVLNDLGRSLKARANGSVCSDLMLENYPKLYAEFAKANKIAAPLPRTDAAFHKIDPRPPLFMEYCKALEFSEKDKADSMKTISSHREKAGPLLARFDLGGIPETASECETLRARLREKMSVNEEYRRLAMPLFRTVSYGENFSAWDVVFGALASFDRAKDREKIHILGFLYRLEKQGADSRKFIFPFYSKTVSGTDETVSFAWRLYRRETKNGKTTRHLFFLPY